MKDTESIKRLECAAKEGKDNMQTYKAYVNELVESAEGGGSGFRKLPNQLHGEEVCSSLKCETHKTPRLVKRFGKTCS